MLTRIKDKDLNKKSLESLIKCGALDEFGYDRGVLLGNSENLLSFYKEHQESGISKKQHSLFSGSSIEMTSKLKIGPAPNATADDKLHWEKELLGLYVSSHPFAEFQQIMANALTPINELSAVGKKQWVVVGGVIEGTKKKITRAGAAMMFVTIQDVTGPLELLVFPKTYETTKNVWVEGTTVCVVGRTGDEEGDDKLFVERAYTITKENVRQLSSQMAQNNLKPSVRDYVPKEALEKITEEGFEIALTPEIMKEKSEAIKLALVKFPGTKRVFLKVGGKKIKTQYTVDDSEELKSEIALIVGR
jgi:DNA polymerase III subunit alpha